MKDCPAWYHQNPDDARVREECQYVFDRAAAGDLVRYGCADELEIPLTEPARRLNMTVAGVGHAVKRCEKGAKAKDWSLDDGRI